MTPTAPVVFVDTETTGLHWNRRIWEYGGIRRENGKESKLHLFVKDVDLSAADPMGLKIGGFYERHPQYMDVDELCDPYLDAQEKLWSENLAAISIENQLRGAHIIGAIPSFDVHCFEMMFRRHSLAPSWHYHIIDVEALAVGYLAAYHRTDLEANTKLQPPWSSDMLTELLGLDPIPEAERHTAMGDAYWAMRIYDKVMGT